MIVKELSKTFNGKTVLETDKMVFENGRIYAIIGANGSGKSTFAKIIAGVIEADGGEKVTDAEKIGYMPQKSFPFRMSVKGNIMLKVKDEHKASRLMEKLEIDSISDKSAKKLSGGETARMALARILMDSYDLLILDEPCASMDMKSTLLSEEIVKEYTKETDCVVIIITHSIAQAKRVADETIFLNNGRLVERGETLKMFDNPEKEKTKEFIKFYGA